MAETELHQASSSNAIDLEKEENEPIDHKPSNPTSDSDDESSDNDPERLVHYPSRPQSTRSRSRPDLSREPTRQLPPSSLRRVETTLSTIRSRKPVPPFNHPLTHTPTTADVVVEFDGPDDPYRPLNWPTKKKVITTVLYGLTTMGSTWASSIFSPAVNPVSQEFGVGTEVSLLGISLLLFGFGLGPLLWAPLSEVYGRKAAVLTPYFLAAIFSFATAVSKDIQTILITRFFTGFFGAAPVTNTGGVLGDIFTPQQRGVAIVGYAMAVVGGPTLGPIVGGAMVQSGLSWRWTGRFSPLPPIESYFTNEHL